MITQKDVELLKDEFSGVFVTKKEFHEAINKIMDKMDKFLAIFTKVDQEQTVISNKVSEHTDNIENLQTRVGRIEKHLTLPL